MRRFLLAALVLLAACSGDSDRLAACSPERVETDSGLVVRDLECGTGPQADRGAVTISYEASVRGGEVFATSDDQGGEFRFALGRGQVIGGLDEGIQGMSVGGERSLEIPPDLAYGDAGFPPDVPPGATVVYRVRLLEVSED